MDQNGEQLDSCKYNRPKRIGTFAYRVTESVEKNEGKYENHGGDGDNSIGILKGEATRFTDYSFGKVQTQELTVTGVVNFSGIAMGNPVDGGTVTIPPNVSIVILQNLYPYTQLIITMPLQPEYGQMITIVSTVNISNLTFTNATFGTTTPIAMVASVPIRLLFAGSWFNI